MLLDTIAPTYVKARAEKERKGLRDTGLLWIMLAVEVRKRERERERERERDEECGFPLLFLLSYHS